MNFIKGFLAAVVLTWWAFIIASAYKAEEPKPVMDTIYYTSFGGTYCGSMKYTSCGVHLWNCANEIEYVCLHGVGIKKASSGEKPAEN